ncbi:AIPR family protein [Christiangramia crocea]|uniref:AIPR family protein n=1 Tax=Christiangramia crocea TaxID=2904124 RepID=A0A9X2A6Q7_9FLAO|nr:AIPR family protein [Gramella crocea]MCG9970727.1 AIPR family protein [Gramella crocea]
MNNAISNIQIDFELEQYIQDLFHEVNSLAFAEEDGASKEDKFTEHIMEILSEAGETEGIRLCHYEKENRWENIQFKINGYAIEDGFETLDIFISSFRDTTENYKVSKPDFDKLIKWSTGFVNAALKGHMEDIEPSSEAYGLAKMILKNRKEFVRINIFILSNGNIPHDPPKNFKIKNVDEITFNFHVWDIERLHRLSQSKYNREPIEINFEETLGAVIPCLTMPSDHDLYECYLAIVPGNILGTLYQNYGTRLLESNVRAFLQQTGKVNKGIRDTIRQEPHMFLPYNNGLATTAQEVKTSYDEKGSLVITGVKDFQIVNGGQTTASLFHTKKKYKDADLSQVFVQMKLTVIKDEDKKNETVPFISRYANSQNKVSELDLTSNNPLLQRFEELSRTTYALDPEDSNKQTIWFFERVKGQYREAMNKEPTKSKKTAFKLKYPRNQVILKSQIARNMNIWKQLPHHVSKGGQKNYNFFLKDVEAEFSKKKKPGSIYWQDIVANTILYNTANTLFGRKNQDPVGDTNIKSYTVAYTLAYLHFLTDNKLDLGIIWQKQMVEEDLQKEIKKGLRYVYNFLINLDTALISEAAKAQKTWEKLKSKKDHGFNMAVIDKYVITEKEFKNRYENKTDDSEEVRKYTSLEKITSVGITFWDGLIRYNNQVMILNEIQSNFANTIRKKLLKSGQLTDIEIKKGVKIIDHLQNEGIDFKKISDLSKVKAKELIDPSNIYNRLSKLDENQWKRIIALGEQTKTLSFNELSVIKTVQQKIKRKESIDLKRLQIVHEAVLKLKKFKISI